MVTPIAPRRSTSLTDKQERFVHEYLIDLDRHRALTAAGYTFSSTDSADAMASALLSNIKVKSYLLDCKAKIASEYTMDAVKWVEYLRLVVLEAIEEGEWAGAVAALREIGKHLGCYELDHQQKHVTPADVDRMKAELISRGMDFTRKNFPPHLLDQVKPAQPKDGDS